MGNVVLYMSMSVDGFIAGPDDGADHGLGIDGEVLHEWLWSGGVDPRSHRPTNEANAAVFDEMMATGAVITGRNTFEYAGHWNGDHHDGVPVFVLTHRVPDEPQAGAVRYVSDLETCVAQAKEAAGDRGGGAVGVSADRHLAARRIGGAVMPARRLARRDPAPPDSGAARSGPAAVRPPAA